jgi:hypothetical protein
MKTGLSSSRNHFCRNWHLGLVRYAALVRAIQVWSTHDLLHAGAAGLTTRLPRLHRAGPSTSLDKSHPQLFSYA